MSKKITEDQSKLDLVARLVKDGAIDFSEAIKLLEVETEIQTVNIPTVWPQPLDPGYPPYGWPTITYANTPSACVNESDIEFAFRKLKN